VRVIRLLFIKILAQPVENRKVPQWESDLS